MVKGLFKINDKISLVISFIGIILIFVLTYFFTKWISLKSAGLSQSKHIKIKDRIALSQNKYLAIIEVSNKHYLLSITDSSINILKELDELEAYETESTNSEFGKIFSDILKIKHFKRGVND